MGLKIYWTEFAEKELERIFEYHREKANYGIAQKLVNGIYNKTLGLKEQPEIGKIEELLKERKQQFRFLVYKNYKIIYWLNPEQNRVEITDVFDTRQSPIKISRTS
jgi:plasmid stabilization system protein ParE